jgi:hypothetical protein
MRRTNLLSLGVVELLVAIALGVCVWQLPAPDDVTAEGKRLESAGRRGGEQVRRLRADLERTRARQPEADRRAEELRREVTEVREALRQQQLDYATVRTMSDALGQSAAGLDEASLLLDPETPTRVSKALGVTGAFFELALAPAADQAADRIEKTTLLLRQDAERLKALVRSTQLDLKTAKAVHDAMERFGLGLDQLHASLGARKVDEVRDGLNGLEKALTAAANQVDRLAGYTYPVVHMQGLRPVVEQHPFWAEGKNVASGLRQAARGASAASREAEALERDLPRLREALAESRQVVDQTRNSLAVALKNQETLEPLLRDVPDHVTRLADELPTLADDLARVLRDTARLRSVGKLLTDAQTAIDKSTVRWPELRLGLESSAELLRASQRQMQAVLTQEDQHRRATRQALAAADVFTNALPAFTRQVDADLAEQDQSLSELQEGVDGVTATVPGVTRSAGRVLMTVRVLLVLLAVVFGLHALSRVTSGRKTAQTV